MSTYFLATALDQSSISQHFQGIAKAIAQKDRNVVILTVSNKTHLQLDEKIKIFRWPNINRAWSFSNIFFLGKLLLRFKPAVVISNGYGRFGYLMLAGSFILRVPTRIDWWHLVKVQIDIDYRHWFSKKLFLFKRVVFNFLVRPYVAAVSNQGQKDLKILFRINPKKTLMFNNSLKDLYINGLATENQRRFICVARFEESKGIDVLIRAVSILKQEGQNTHVDILGDGPNKGQYSLLRADFDVEDQVHLLGVLPQVDVYSLIAKAYALILPSRSDNKPLVIIEALSMGVPVIASGVGGVLEMLRDGIDGFLVPPNNPDALAQKMKELMLNPALRDEMSKNARARFLDKYEQKKQASKIAEKIISLEA